MEIKRILCPIDFSDASSHAVDQAVAMARWYSARIAALHVCSPSLISLPQLDKSPATTATGDAHAERLRDKIAAQCDAATVAGVGLDILVEVGQPERHILECAKRLPAELIVMGTHGTSGLQHLVLGSVTEKVLRKAACPVLTVPPRAHATSRLPFRQLLCAIDFSDSSLFALQFALSVARESNAELTMLHVLEWPWHEPPAPSADDLPPQQAVALAEYRRYCEESAAARLRSLAPDTLSPTRRPEARIRHGKPYVETLRLAAEQQADLIVVGVHGRNPLDVNLFGSTANQLVRLRPVRC